jgi:hypothetical protein
VKLEQSRYYQAPGKTAGGAQQDEQDGTIDARAHGVRLP